MLWSLTEPFVSGPILTVVALFVPPPSFLPLIGHSTRMLFFTVLILLWPSFLGLSDASFTLAAPIPSQYGATERISEQATDNSHSILCGRQTSSSGSLTMALISFLSNLMAGATNFTPSFASADSPVTLTDSAPGVVAATYSTLVEPGLSASPVAGNTTVPDSASTVSAQAFWTSPQGMTDLSSFNITYFPTGQGNVDITNAPSVPNPYDPNTSALSAHNLPLPTVGLTPMLQLFFPANSINPAAKPQGGAEFYASPIDLSAAQSVTLEYDVFFPKQFDWVLAGKLPGLYGGHHTCSGGDDALDCFSTRLMWRQDGKGELYLYAPRDKQTDALCQTPPQSICESSYGMSIGRGSFYFTTGNWTHVKQTVTLNTPGQQDGTFILEVNGEEVINRSDVFYRDAPADASTSQAQSAASKGLSLQIPDLGLPSGASGGLSLGGLLDPLLGGPTAARRSNRREILRRHKLTKRGEWPLFLSRPQQGESGATSVGTESENQTPVGFQGLFFSTFFGGHEAQYATPMDQYTWFKSFAIVVNS